MNTERTLLWFLLWAVLIVIALIGQYQLKISRDFDRLHSATNASFVQPSTIYVHAR